MARLSFKLLAELPTSVTEWNDTSVGHGKEYVYRVNIFSKEGEAGPVPVLIRKTVP
ncbi:hypothetical protein caldi_32330 [Caldinitratiruptor microaerophilus]|uniref:Uncharacterized protein n=1 Tax=Caldinitratiruptor microaerophilus TaxID=671077 RepID=A0AA35CP43_9FIRM|nr:hypothetical protein caldi_32330 [Caldinitratiruptor microaerophilus]